MSSNSEANPQSGTESGKRDGAGSGVSAPFRAILTPHRSLSRRGFGILMACFGVVCFAAGMFFLSLGAWPVFAFFGLDVLLLYVAFRVNYQSGREYETIELTPQSLTLTRVTPAGREDSVVYNPFWVRVLLSEWPDGRTSLRLASHGEETIFARFLTDDERKDFAGALKDALLEARAVRATI